MLLRRSADDSRCRPAVAEGDPLPPDDRLMPHGRLDILYRLQAPRLLRRMMRRTSNDNAGDIVQQVFTRFAALGGHRVGSIEAPAAYLNRIADNLLRDEAKIAVRRSVHLHVAADSEELVGDDQVAALEARDMLKRLEAIMMRLKPRTREIFMAHRLDGYTYREIAERTGLGVKCIEKHMTIAIAHLDRCMPDR